MWRRSGDVSAATRFVALLKRMKFVWDRLLEHRVIPLADDIRLDQAFENERVLADERLGCFARSEDRHVATVRERADADDVASRFERIDHCLVPRIDGHDRVHRGACPLTDDYCLHALLPGGFSSPLSVSTTSRGAQ